MGVVGFARARPTVRLWEEAPLVPSAAATLLAIAAAPVVPMEERWGTACSATGSPFGRAGQEHPVAGLEEVARAYRRALTFRGRTL